MLCDRCGRTDLLTYNGICEYCTSIYLAQVDAERRGTPARLDSNKDSTPKTRIVAHVEAGKAPWPHNIQRYELKDNKETQPMNPDSKFTLSIDLLNDGMKTPADVAHALREVAKGLRTMPASLATAGGKIRDVNGNTVGGWELNNA